MKELIKINCGIVVSFFTIIIILLTIALMFGNWNTANMDRVIWTYVISGFMILCNGVVYAILEGVDVINRRLT